MPLQIKKMTIIPFKPSKITHNTIENPNEQNIQEIFQVDQNTPKVSNMTRMCLKSSK